MKEKEVPVTLQYVQNMYAQAGGRYLLLLLVEADVPRAKPGIPTLTYRVLSELTAKRGPLDEALTNFSSERPSVNYRRLVLDRKDSAVLTTIGVTWLPQVRLVRKGRVLIRSSVSLGDDGQFLAQDVGGRSFIRRAEPSAAGYYSLTDVLHTEIERSKAR